MTERAHNRKMFCGCRWLPFSESRDVYWGVRFLDLSLAMPVELRCKHLVHLNNWANLKVLAEAYCWLPTVHCCLLYQATFIAHDHSLTTMS